MFQLLVYAMLVTPPAPVVQQPDPEIRRTVDKMFDAMRAKDTTALRAVFDTATRLVTTFVNPSGQPTMRVTAIGRFIQSIGGAQGKLDERIYDVEVRQSDRLATVWARYTFFLDDQVSHCGYDALQLFQSAEGWKIFAIADTQRREGCSP